MKWAASRTQSAMAIVSSGCLRFLILTTGTEETARGYVSVFSHLFLSFFRTEEATTTKKKRNKQNKQKPEQAFHQQVKLLLLFPSLVLWIINPFVTRKKPNLPKLCLFLGTSYVAMYNFPMWVRHAHHVGQHRKAL